MPETNWQKSSYSSDGDGNACLELTTALGAIHLRESDTPAVVLRTDPAPLAALLGHIKSVRKRQLSQ